jgi:hypothetical protein
MWAGTDGSIGLRQQRFNSIDRLISISHTTRDEVSDARQVSIVPIHSCGDR